MNIALVRVGIDSGNGGIQGPLFKNGTFEYLPIPDGFNIDERTYGNTPGRFGPLIDYFPPSSKKKMLSHSIHFDPEFETFTYGDPTPPKAGLRNLNNGDILIFYCGLEGWDFPSPPALYIMGYFEVLMAGRACDFSDKEIAKHFSNNFHVRHKSIYDMQKGKLVLVKGSEASCLLNKAVLMSDEGRDKAGRPLKVLSPEIQKIFGDFDGKLSFQRSPTRWVKKEYISLTARFIKSLP